VAAERAFLHDPFCSDGDISIKGTLHLLRPFGWIPIKVFDGVRASGGAVAATNASVIDLGHESFFVDVRRIDRADLRAGRIVAMHARSWKKPAFDMRILPFDIRDQFNPVDGTTLGGLLRPDDRRIVFCLAGNHARLTGGAFV
jgi:hypothetical protein